MRTDIGAGANVLYINDSFRTMASQEHAWRCNHTPNPGEDCSDIGGRAAEPGTSNHQLGYAIDFAALGREGVQAAPGEPVWNWLNANAATYGFSSNVGESWHWSVTGQ